jgi:hypothetical protein
MDDLLTISRIQINHNLCKAKITSSATVQIVLSGTYTLLIIIFFFQLNYCTRKLLYCQLV